MKKLVCDRCGREVTERYDIQAMLMGTEAWHASVRARGAEPRGLFPCQEYRNCGGEMIEVEEQKRIFRRRKSNGD